MSYRVKRIDPYGSKNPILSVVAVVGVAAALALMTREGSIIPAAVAGAVGGIAMMLCVAPAISAMLATLGFAGGLVQFFIVPNAQNATMTVPYKLLSTLLFTLFYAVLMDGVVLLVSVLYNLFAGGAGLGGLSFELEDDASEDGA